MLFKQNAVSGKPSGSLDDRYATDIKNGKAQCRLFLIGEISVLGIRGQASTQA
jgi:hypothetical protein